MALVFTATAGVGYDNGYASKTHTFSSVAIGTASADRIVIVGFGNRRGDAAGTTITIGGISATLAIENSDYSFGIYYANVTSGTTANIVVTVVGANSLEMIGISVGYITGANATPTSIVAALSVGQADPFSIGTVTVPTGGVAVACMCATDNTPKPTITWTNATQETTGEYDVQTGNYIDGAMGSRTTAGSIAISVSGFPYWGRRGAIACWEPAAGGAAVTGPFPTFRPDLP